MQKRTEELISMLMDNELDEKDASAVIREMEDTERWRSCWEHYHLISAAVSKDLPASIDPEFASRVSCAIQNEPPHHYSPRLLSNRLTTFKGSTGFALAASFAVVALVGLLRFNTANHVPGVLDQQLANAPQTNHEKDPGVQALADASLHSDLPSKEDRWVNIRENQSEAKPSLLEPKLYDYLVNDSNTEYAFAAPVQGAMLPYARIVGYDPGY